MKTSWKTFFSFSMFTCFIVFMVFGLHPLTTNLVQADEADNKSVLDGYKNANGQVPKTAETEGIDLEVQPSGDEVEPAADTDDILEDQSLFAMFFQLFFALAIIIIMIYALIRFIGKRSQSYQSHRTLQNLGGVHVGTNRSIQLVKVGGNILVVGVGETIQLLKEISKPEEINKILQDQQNNETDQQLTSVFHWVQKKFKNQNEESSSGNYFKSFLESELRDVKNSQKKAHATIKEREK